MAGPYIPTQDALLDEWARNFSTLISATPANYGLLPADAVTIAQAVAIFRLAYAKVAIPENRTAILVIAKDNAKADMLIVVRAYAMIIKSNLGITDQLKAGLGLNIDDPTPTPIGPPDTCPILMIMGATPGCHTLRFADYNTPAARRKPFGAVHIQLFAATTTVLQPAPDPENCNLIGSYTKNNVSVLYALAEDGKKAWYYSRWITRRGYVGPWSSPVGMTIAW